VPPAAPIAGQLTGGVGYDGGRIFCNNALNLGKVDVIGMGTCVCLCSGTWPHHHHRCDGRSTRSPDIG
jgi:hypothetical protein